MRIERVDLAEISRAERLAFEALSTFRGRIYLQSSELQRDALVLAVFEGAHPIGWLIANRDRFLKKAEIEEFNLLPECWKAGFATKLLEEVHRQLCEEEMLLLLFYYDHGTPRAARLNELLDAHRYLPEKRLLRRLHFDALHFNPPWLLWKMPSIDEGTIFPWVELPEAEKVQLMRAINGWGIPRSVSPFGECVQIVEPLCSFGLEVKGVTVGWIVAHRVAHDTVRYSSFFLKEPYRRGTYVLKMMQKAILAQKAAEIPYAYIELNDLEITDSWKAFVKKRLQGYVIGYSETVSRWRKLGDEGLL